MAVRPQAVGEGVLPRARLPLWGIDALALLALLLLAGAPGGAAPAQSSAWDGLISLALAQGGKYRILFVTSGTSERILLSDSERTNIDNWNAKVQAVADSHTHFSDSDGDPMTDDGIEFRILGSTAGTNARTNTSTRPNADDVGTNVPIYHYKGDRLADNYADMYDGTWARGHGAPPPGIPTPNALAWRVDRQQQ